MRCYNKALWLLMAFAVGRKENNCSHRKVGLSQNCWKIFDCPKIVV